MNVAYYIGSIIVDLLNVKLDVVHLSLASPRLIVAIFRPVLQYNLPLPIRRGGLLLHQHLVMTPKLSQKHVHSCRGVLAPFV